jgi:hypothetical protein
LPTDGVPLCAVLASAHGIVGFVVGNYLRHFLAFIGTLRPPRGRTTERFTDCDLKERSLVRYRSAPACCSRGRASQCSGSAN